MVDVASRAKHQNDICSKEIELCVHNMVTSLGSVVNVIKGGPVKPLNEHQNLHLDNE